MKVGITGSVHWSRPEVAEELVSGFIAGLPSNTIILGGGQKEGVDRWVQRHAQAQGRNLTVFEPAHVKGAAHHVLNFSQRDKNLAEGSDKVFIFQDNQANEDDDSVLASLVTVLRLQHVPHVTYLFTDDERDEKKLQLVSAQEMNIEDMLPKKEEANDVQRSSVPRKRAHQSTGKRGSKVQPHGKRKRNPTPTPRKQPQRKSKLSARVRTTQKKTSHDAPRRTKAVAPVSTKRAGTGTGKQSGSRIVLKRRKFK